MTLAEMLAQAGIAEEVVKGLDPKIASAVESHLTAADGKLSEAAEYRRQAELEKQEIHEYVEKYGSSLTQLANTTAENQALKTYLESLKAQGFDIKLPVAGQPAPAPAVPGSPAIGGNVDPNEIYGKVGVIMSSFLDANNEHIRLYGTPLPDNSTNLAEEARRARKPLGDYIAEKYKFDAKRQEVAAEARKKEIDAEVAKRVEEEKRKLAEANGGNPNLRPGFSSTNSTVPKIKGEEFHKADGNVPQRERLRRVIEGVHKDIAAANGAA